MTGTDRPTPTAADLTVAVRGVRAVVGIIAASLAPALEQVTMPQFRALVLLRALGRTPAGVLAERLGVTPSTATRLVERLVRDGWVDREHGREDRRHVTLALTRTGEELVDDVRARREDALQRILDGLGADERAAVLHGLDVLARAAGEPAPEDLQVLGLPDQG